MKWLIVIGLFIYVELTEGTAIRVPSQAPAKDSSITDTTEKEYIKSEEFSTYEDVRLEAECLVGSEWVSNCHTCRCSEEGRAICLKQEVCDKTYGEPLKCKPETSFKRDCNMCRCLDNGLVLCTMKGCSRGTILLKADLQSGKDCSPGTSWKSRCNDCFCSEEGVRNCTILDCPGQENEPVLRCAPDSRWRNECNTCWCTTNGHAMCTKMGCSMYTVSDWKPQPAEEVENRFLSSAPKSVNASDVVCTANRMFIRDCNTCWCNDDGTGFFCTRKVCVLPEEGEENPENLRTIKKQCRPDEVFELDCNTCRCNSDGESYSCTRRVCVSEPDEKDKNRRKRATSQQKPNPDTAPSRPAPTLKGAPKNCQPNQEFRLDCNKCLCDNEGQNYSCTRIDCAALNNNNGADRTKREVASQEQLNCTPGTVFDQGCNVCQCTTDGNHAVCSMKRCHDESENDINAPENDPNFRCNPGEQFKRGCKDCTCSADGRSTFCTLRLCDQDINPAL
ncbi:uncharacterized protein LOC125050289 isoform X2 [Pieris napi]|uniref:uncharacterized protein LOC125050289 isoform X2 n=1 Tax=Pieris napi TaxID=78633 RepID=UPI001FBBAB8B|nr:uncharacterized protein LOC125050289 isoform X2 [Pieris napi]